VGAIRISEERGVRYLHFGSRWIQGAMRVSRPFALELEYTREMMLPLILRERGDWPARALAIGLGAGSIPKFLVRHLPGCQITVVELREDVIGTARAWFKLPEDPRLRIEVGEGARWMGAAGPRHDLILVDGFDARGRNGKLDTLAFYRDCRARLAPHGFLVANVLGRSRSVEPTLARLRTAFAGRAIALPPSEAGNVVVLATTGDPVDMDAGGLRRRAERLHHATGLRLSPTLARIAARPGLAQAW
jgi:spermidine synthase